MLELLVGPVSNILDKFIEDKDQKAKLAHEIATMAERHAQEQVLAQLEVNKAKLPIVACGWLVGVLLLVGLVGPLWLGTLYCFRLLCLLQALQALKFLNCLHLTWIVL